MDNNASNTGNQINKIGEVSSLSLNRFIYDLELSFSMVKCQKFFKGTTHSWQDAESSFHKVCV